MVQRSPWPKRVAVHVRAQITASGLSKLKVSELSGIPPSTFNRRYDGTDPWNTRELDRVAKALRINPNDLIPVDPPTQEATP